MSEPTDISWPQILFLLGGGGVREGVGGKGGLVKEQTEGRICYLKKNLS